MGNFLSEVEETIRTFIETIGSVAKTIIIVGGVGLILAGLAFAAFSFFTVRTIAQSPQLTGAVVTGAGIAATALAPEIAIPAAAAIGGGRALTGAFSRAQ